MWLGWRDSSPLASSTSSKVRSRSLAAARPLAFARRYLSDTIGSEREAGYRLCAVSPGLILSRSGWHVTAFPVAHRGTESLGYLFEEATHQALLPERLDVLGVPRGPERAALAGGHPVVLADGRTVTPEMVQGPSVAGAKLAIIGDVEEVASLVEPVRRADALVIEATFLERDAALARSRGHLTAAAAAQLAREAEIGELLLTHISGRYKAEEILAEAAGLFPEGSRRRRFRSYLGDSRASVLEHACLQMARVVIDHPDIAGAGPSGAESASE